MPPNIQPPTPAEVRGEAANPHIDLSESEVEGFETLIAVTLEDYERLDELSAPSPGAEVTEASVPMHPDGLPIWNAIAVEETTATVDVEGVGHNAETHGVSRPSRRYTRVGSAPRSDVPSPIVSAPARRRLSRNRSPRCPPC